MVLSLILSRSIPSDRVEVDSNDLPSATKAVREAIATKPMRKLDTRDTYAPPLLMDQYLDGWDVNGGKSGAWLRYACISTRASHHCCCCCCCCDAFGKCWTGPRDGLGAWAISHGILDEWAGVAGGVSWLAGFEW